MIRTVPLRELFDAAQPIDTRGVFVATLELTPMTPSALIGENPLEDDRGQIEARTGLVRLMREDEFRRVVRTLRDGQPDASDEAMCAALTRAAMR